MEIEGLVLESLTTHPNQEMMQDSPQNVSPEDVVRFDTALANTSVPPAIVIGDPNIPAAEHVTSVSQEGSLSLGDKVLHNMLSLENGFKELSFESPSLDSLKQTAEESSSPVTKNMFSMMDYVHEIHSKGMQLALWSSQVNIMSTAITKTTSGLQTLFKSGGA